MDLPTCQLSFLDRPHGAPQSFVWPPASQTPGSHKTCEVIFGVLHHVWLHHVPSPTFFFVRGACCCKGKVLEGDGHLGADGREHSFSTLHNLEFESQVPLVLMGLWTLAIAVATVLSWQSPDPNVAGILFVHPDACSCEQSLLRVSGC